MDALCRGEDILPPSERSKLVCYFSSMNNPYFIIQPIKVFIYWLLFSFLIERILRRCPSNTSEVTTILD